jgi:predicted phage terminase large subunit-like protein
VQKGSGAPPGQQKFSEHEIIASICKDSFYDFVTNFWEVIIPERPVWNWHIKYLADELQAVAERVFRGEPKLYDLVINISPGTSKSSLVTIMFPAWCWTRMPSCRIISASYAFSLAMDLSRKSRDLIKSEKYRKCFPYIEIREDQDTKHYFVNSKGGDRYAAGVNGSVLGMHAHIQVVDDPLDPNQSASEAELKAVNNWMNDYLPGRKIDKALTPLILVQQRLHEEDPSGVMLRRAKKYPDQVKVRHVCLPAELPPPDKSNVSPPELTKFYTEGLMDPVRMSREVLDEYKTRGVYLYSSQFMQSPVPIGGGMFKAEYFNQRSAAAPYKARRIRFWDRAATQDGGDYSAGVLMAAEGENFYVEHVVRGQWEPYQRNQIILATAQRDRSKYGPYNEPLIYVEREGGSAGRDAWKSVARALAGFPVYEGYITGDKETRARPLSAQLAARNFYVVDDDTWDVNAYVAELCSFPMGRFDDQVDASSGAFNLLVGSRPSIGLRILTIKDVKRRPGVHVIVCPQDKLDTIALDKPTLLVNFQDPKSQDVPPLPSPPNLLISSLPVRCAPLEITDYQDRWEEPVPGYEEAPPALLMDRERAKGFWAFALKKRDPHAEAFVFSDQGGGLALSAAMALCDALRISKKDTLVFVEPVDKIPDEPPNRTVYDAVRSARSLVV